MHKYVKKKFSLLDASFFGKYVFWDGKGFGVIMSDDLVFQGEGWSGDWATVYKATEFGKAFVALSLEEKQTIWRSYVAQLDELIEQSRSLPQNIDNWEQHFLPTITDKLKMLEFTFRMTGMALAVERRLIRQNNNINDSTRQDDHTISSRNMENTKQPDTVRAICINPQARTVTDVLIPNNDSLEIVYKLLNCESVQLDVYAVKAPHYMYVDEEGMYNENCAFSINGYVYYGAALIFCKALDEEKEYADCTLQLHHIKEGVVFYDQTQTAIEKAAFKQRSSG